MIAVVSVTGFYMKANYRAYSLSENVPTYSNARPAPLDYHPIRMTVVRVGTDTCLSPAENGSATVKFRKPEKTGRAFLLDGGSAKLYDIQLGCVTREPNAWV